MAFTGQDINRTIIDLLGSFFNIFNRTGTNRGIIVRDRNGTEGTDEIHIFHDGTDAIIKNMQSGGSVVLRASDDTAAASTVGTLSAGAIAASDSSLGVTGLAATAATGGAVVIAGGATTTSGVGGLVSATGGAGAGSDLGGAASLVGGAGGATGAGGAATVTGGAGGATSGAGGAATVTGGAGTGVGAAGAAGALAGGAGAVGTGTTAGGNGAAATVTGGAGAAKTGTGAAAGGVGGAVTLTAGVGEATASSGSDAGGVAGNINLTGAAGGAASAGTGNGGAGSSILATPGTGGTSAGGTAGVDGGLFFRGNTFFKQSAPTAKGDGAQSVTAAQLINGICVHTITTGCTLTTPTGAQITAAMPPDAATGDSFLFTLITVGTGADDISTLTAGDGNVTFVGKVTVGPDTAAIAAYGTFLFRKTGASTYVGYRIG